jgi:mannose-6-phosphate isomerase-like protein (cupin superfamily)
MRVRRIVTEERDGRSAVTVDGMAPHTWCDEIWATTADAPLGADPDGHVLQLAPPPGGTSFRLVELPPDAVMRASLAGGSAHGVDPEGFHRTPTIDYVYVLDGPVELVLDTGSVTVEPGDCVVQRGTTMPGATTATRRSAC